MGPDQRLPWSQRVFFGVGHCLNDLAASMWFSYLMVYLQLVLGFDANYAGFLLLVGQLADAVATPLLGLEAGSPASPGGFAQRYGKRKCLHLFGTLCVIGSFPFLFSVCPGCENASEFAYTVMLTPLVVIFQVGWAAVQVSHLSLIPVITPCEQERDFLNVFRYAVGIVSSISTYIIVWAVIDLTSKPEGVSSIISVEYADKFLMIVLIVIGIGAFFSLLFHLGVKEVQYSSLNSSSENSFEEEDRTKHPSGKAPFRPQTLSWRGWIREKHFYQVGMLYMFSRLYQNMSAVFLSLYLQQSLKADDDFIAKIPLVMSVSSFFVSCTLPKSFKILSKKCTLLAGSLLGIGASAWVLEGAGDGYRSGGVYGVGVMMGAASAMLGVSSLSFIHDLIGTSSETGGFVYGSMSFLDKLANGAVVMIIQHFHSATCNNCDWFYRCVLSFGLGSAAGASAVTLLTLLPSKLGQRQSSYNKTQKVISEVINYGALASAEEETS